MSEKCYNTKINRNDMLELTRRMTLSRNCFVRAAGAYIDDEGYIDNTFNVNFKNMSKHDQQINLNLAKTIPFSKTNEQLKCYKFPEEDMAYDSIHKLLMALSQYGLKDDLLVQTLCEQLAEGICDTKDSSDKINCLQGQVIYALSDFLIMIVSWLVKQSLRAFLSQEVQP